MADYERTPIPPDGVTNPYNYHNPTAPMDNGQPTAQIGDNAPYANEYTSDPFSPASRTGDLGGGAQQAADPNPSYAHAGDTAAQPQVMKATAKPEKKKGGKTTLTAVISSAITAALVSALMSFAPIGANDNNNQSVNATTGDITVSTDGQTSVAEAVAAKCLNSAVTIYVYSNSSSDWSQMFGGGSSSSSTTPSALGSGVIISENNGTYYILTNYHVVEGISKAVVKVGEQQFEASSVGYDEKTDLAVISIKGEGLTVAEWGDSQSLNIGEWVAAIGAPYGYEQTLTTGIVSALYRSDTISSSSSLGSTVYTDMIQTDAAINPGNSGGGLFDAEGKLIGINTYISSTSQSSAGLGFAIPQSNAQEIAEEIISGKTVEHAFLGVSMGNVDADGGVTVAAVYKGTAAAEAGLKTGDIITKVDNKTITSAANVTEAVRSHKVGDKINITYKRDGKESTVEATLGTDNNVSDEYAEGGEPATQNNSNGNGNGSSNGGNGGNGFGWGNSGGDDYFGFDLDELFGGNPFSYGYGDSDSGSGSGNSGSGNSRNGNSGGFWN